MIEALVAGAAAVGGAIAWRAAYSGARTRGCVFSFHHVDPSPIPGFTWVTPRFFRRVVDALSGSPIEFVPASRFADGRGEAGTVALTFDDGYESLVEHAFPLLVERDVPATLFVVAGAAGRMNTWDYAVAGWGRRRHIGWTQLRELSDAGVEIGSHTMTHPDLRGLPLLELRKELEDSRKTIEDRLGRRVALLSYPFGLYDARVQRAAREGGYEAAFAATPRAFEKNLQYAVARRSVYRFDTLLDVRLAVSGGPLRSISDLRGLLVSRWAAGTPIAVPSRGDPHDAL